MKIVAVAALTLLLGPIIGLSVLLGVGGAADAAVALCQTSGPVDGLTDTQSSNARAVVASAQQATIEAELSPADQERAELIALMTAETESTLHNYANPQVPASGQLPHDGQPPSGGDHDSVGLFQQRASWGSLTARMTPTETTKLFTTRLLSVPAWQNLPAGDAAQAVQSSAYPDRYADSQTDAEAWLAQIAGSADVTTCGSDGLLATATATIPAGSIPGGYTIPVDATDAARRAVTFALAQLGKPYVFGAAGPDTYDCSGLTMAAWRAGGVTLPHYTVSQYALGTPVAALSLASPGDLVFIPGSDGTLYPPNPQHVGMYLGDGYVIEAPQTGDVVKIVPSNNFQPVIGIRHVG